jgi:hypothetical protein
MIKTKKMKMMRTKKEKEIGIAAILKTSSSLLFAHHENRLLLLNIQERGHFRLLANFEFGGLSNKKK